MNDQHQQTSPAAAKLSVERNSRGYTVSVTVYQQLEETEEDVNRRLTRHMDYLETLYPKE